MNRLTALVLMALLACPALSLAAQLPTISLGVTEASSPQQVSTTLQVLFLLTILSLAPAILLRTTAFIRVVIVLSFIRQAMGTMQMPPNQVVIGLALFLTFFIMSPVIQQINDTALQPYLKQEIAQEQGLELALKPMRQFMFSQVKEGDLALLLEISGQQTPDNTDDVPTMTLIPAFMLSELSRAFQIGFIIFIPFLVIDMVVASVLMSMGMMMLPPVIISLPFKLLLFVLVDGWSLVIGSLVQSFQ
jgi:flagellar biosynthetic protein FliP